MADPKLSIVVFCFNHEKYVAQALDSIFEQQRLTDVELIIADDCSEDRTSAIIRQKIEAVSHLRWAIKHLERKERLGMQGSVLDALGHAKGKYVALLEGDDYWYDSGKIALQVAVLDDRKEVYLCAHNSGILGDRLERHEWRWQAWKTEFTCLDYLRKNFFHTSSVVMRNPNPLPAWMLGVMQLDFAIVLWGARNGCGGITFIPRSMSVYRKHAGGITQSAAHRNVQASYRSYFLLLEGIREAWPAGWGKFVQQRESEAKVMLHLSGMSRTGKVWGLVRNLPVLWRPALVRFLQWISAI